MLTYIKIVLIRLNCLSINNENKIVNKLIDFRNANTSHYRFEFLCFESISKVRLSIYQNLFIVYLLVFI